MSKKTFHITIIDNETKKVAIDTDFRVLIGGIATEKEFTGLNIASCNDIELAKAVVATENAVKAVKARKNKMFEVFCAMLAAETETAEVDQTKEDTEVAE